MKRKKSGKKKNDKATGALIRVMLIEGKGLTGKDGNGSGDPYVRVAIGKKHKGRSRVVKKNLNPEWNEIWEFYPVDLKKEENEGVLFSVYDKDKFLRDDLIGRGWVSIKDGQDTVDRWLKLHKKKNKDTTTAEGQIRVRVQILDDNNDNSTSGGGNRATAAGVGQGRGKSMYWMQPSFGGGLEEEDENLELLLQYAKQQEAELIAQCEQSGEKWEDPDFAADFSSMFYEGKEKVQTYIDRWARPSDYGAETPKLFLDGVEAGDVVQGGLGDCYFLGALAVVANRPDLLLPLFLSAHPEYGFYQMRFFKNGQWQLVTIDDRLPVKSDDTLIYASCKDKNEMWVPLIEKAYAKLHGCYEAIELGVPSSALMDLTGEAPEVFDLQNNQEMAKMAKKGDLWKLMVIFLEQEKYLMGCVQSVPSAGVETDTGMGILANHAYSVMSAQTIGKKKARLLHLRNPWGKKEWRGKWSDGAKEWTPALMQEAGQTDEEDGAFFMEYSDFVQQFNKVYVLRLLTDKIGHCWQKYSFTGQWLKGKTAGGCPKYPSWTDNPQFAVQVKEATQVYICIMQPDIRMQWEKQYKIAVGFQVLRTKDPRKKKVILMEGDVVFTAPWMKDRELAAAVNLQPGNYTIMCSTFEKEQESVYYLHIYSFHPIRVRQIGGAEEGHLGGAPLPQAPEAKRAGYVDYKGFMKKDKGPVPPERTSSLMDTGGDLNYRASMYGEDLDSVESFGQVQGPAETNGGNSNVRSSRASFGVSVRGSMPRGSRSSRMSFNAEARSPSFAYNNSRGPSMAFGADISGGKAVSGSGGGASSNRATAKFCGVCGKKAPPNFKFCGSCGSSLAL